MKRILMLIVVFCTLLSLMVPLTALSAEGEPSIVYSGMAAPTELANEKGFGNAKEIPAANKLLELKKPETPASGTLKLIKKAAGSGKPLPGAVFEIFSLSDNRKVGEIISGNNGTAELSLPAGEYHLLEKTTPTGYKLETAKILFRVKAGSIVKVEVTNVRDDGDQPMKPTLSSDGATDIIIPKTGEAFPARNYTLAGLLFALAGASGVALWRERKQGRTA